MMPPVICRLFAKSGGQYMTNEEMMGITGWSEVKLKRIVWSASWRNISAGDIDLFLRACGLHWSKRHRSRWLIKLALERGGVETMRHLRGCNRVQKIISEKQLKRVRMTLAADA